MDGAISWTTAIGYVCAAISGCIAGYFAYKTNIVNKKHSLDLAMAQERLRVANETIDHQMEVRRSLEDRLNRKEGNP